MRKIIALAAILTATVPNVTFAADGVMPAALPGPYQFIMVPKQNYVQPTTYAAPQVQNMQQTRQPYWMQTPNQQVVPYWMQNSQQQQQPFAYANPVAVPYGSQGNAVSNTQAGGQASGGFDFNAQARSNNTFNQGYGQSAGPGYFPGYGAGPQAVQNAAPQANTGFAQPQPTPNYQAYQQATPYPQQQGWSGPWNGNWGLPWGGQSFGPWGPVGPTGYGAPTGWGR